MRTILSLLLACALALAGCADGGDDRPAPQDLVVETSPGLGAVVGVVVDEAILPLADAQVVLESDPPREQATDAQGQFAFADVAPGTYFLRVAKAGYDAAQASVEVKADEPAPPVVKVQLARLFDQDPFVEQFKFDGFLTCSYFAVLITAPCITDYTSIVVPGGAAPVLREVQGDTRDYELAIGAGWQQMVIEMAWEPSAAGTSQGLGVTVSHTQRLASHWFASDGGPNPFRLQIDVGAAHPTHQGDPSMIPAEGIPDLFAFVNVQEGEGELAAVALNQEFELFHHTFYYATAPPEWSFVAGDPLPF